MMRWRWRQLSMERWLPALLLTTALLAGCASNVAQIRTKGALDLDCDLSNVNVQLTERPYLGVTRYDATGCGATRSYQCSARYYFLGVPMGDRRCKRSGEPADPVISTHGVRF